MVTAINTRDVTLQSATSRYVAATMPGINIDYTAITGTKPPSNADNTTTAFVGGLSVGAGGIVMSGGAIRASTMTSYNLGTGFFLGHVGGIPCFGIGNSAGQHITWDGTSLNITGNLDFSNITGTKPPANADNTNSALNNNLSTSGQITLTSTGHIKAGATGYNQGLGFFLGFDNTANNTSAFKFFIGDATYPAGPRLLWTGYELDIIGNINGQSNIITTGSAKFDGQAALSGGLSGTGAVIANSSGVSWYGVVAQGFAAGVYTTGTGSGHGLEAHAASGKGVYATTQSGQYAVEALHTSGGNALACLGGFVKSGSELVSNLNAQLWNGAQLVSSTPASGSVACSFNGANKPGGTSGTQNWWLQISDWNSGQTYFIPVWA